MTIPVEALVLNEDQQTVYMLDADNRIQIRTVQVGIEGIKAGRDHQRSHSGDRVILGGQDEVSGRRGSQPVVDSTPASETAQESGGMIDMKAECQTARGGTIMPKFALRYPYFILMICLMVALIGTVDLMQHAHGSFPEIDMPVVVVATFYNGMPPQQIEADITNTFERFFTLAANVDHSESRSLTGVSLIKIYFKPGTNPNAALSNVANLAMADLRRLPPGTLPPVVLGMTASTQPVCLVTLKGEG